MNPNLFNFWQNLFTEDIQSSSPIISVEIDFINMTVYITLGKNYGSYINQNIDLVNYLNNFKNYTIYLQNMNNEIININNIMEF